MDMSMQMAQETPKKHSPLPWRQFDTDANALEIMGADGPTVCEVFQQGGSREIDEAEANAALIVRAVNSHSALVAALFMARPVIDDIANGRKTVTRKQDAEYIVKKIDAALSAAQE